MVNESTSEILREALSEHRLLDCPRSPLTEIVDAGEVIEAHDELTAVLNFPAPFDNE